jgi:uncharacterized protein (DUF433 family)
MRGLAVHQGRNTWRTNAKEHVTGMTQNELIERITVDARIFGGKPIIRGMRIAVEHVLGMLAAGDSPERLLQEYPFLEAEDIQACLAYAHRSLSGEQVQERITRAKAS